MPAWELSIDVDAPPDAAWALVGDPTSVPRWYPKYAAAEVDGDSRVLRDAEAGELRERLLDRDDAARSYSYSVLCVVGAHGLAPLQPVPNESS